MLDIAYAIMFIERSSICTELDKLLSHLCAARIEFSCRELVHEAVEKKTLSEKVFGYLGVLYPKIDHCYKTRPILVQPLSDSH